MMECSIGFSMVKGKGWQITSKYYIFWENSSCDTEFSMSGSHGKAGKVVENDDKNQ